MCQKKYPDINRRRRLQQGPQMMTPKEISPLCLFCKLLTRVELSRHAFQYFYGFPHTR